MWIYLITTFPGLLEGKCLLYIQVWGASHCFIFLNQIKFGVMPMLTWEIKSAGISYPWEASEEVLIIWRRTLLRILSLSKPVMSSEAQQPSLFMVIIDRGKFHHDSLYFLPDKTESGREILTRAFRNKLLAIPLLFRERKYIILPFLIHSRGKKHLSALIFSIT